MDAEALATYIINTLQQHGLDPSKIVSQGYDGASVMSGHYTGVQQRVKQVAPRALCALLRTLPEPCFSRHYQNSTTGT